MFTSPPLTSSDITTLAAVVTAAIDALDIAAESIHIHMRAVYKAHLVVGHEPYARVVVAVEEFRRVMTGHEVRIDTRTYGTEYDGWIDGINLHATEYGAPVAPRMVTL